MSQGRANRAVILLSGRGRLLTAQRTALLVRATGLHWEVREALSVGRTHGGVARVRELALAREVDCVLVGSIAVVARTEALQLGVVAELTAFGVSVVSVAEPWLPDCATTIHHLANWLLERDRCRRSGQVRASLSRARASGVRIGRPRREMPPNAHELVRQLGIGKAARELGLGESTLRRFVRAGQPPYSPTPNPGEAP